MSVWVCLFVSVYDSVYLKTCLQVCLSVCQSVDVYLSVRLHYVSLRVSDCLSCLPVCLVFVLYVFITVFDSLPVCLPSVCLSVSLPSVCLSAKCLSVCLSSVSVTRQGAQIVRLHSPFSFATRWPSRRQLIPPAPPVHTNYLLTALVNKRFARPLPSSTD